jgi:hypothetical protein
LTTRCGKLFPCSLADIYSVTWYTSYI